MEFMTVGGIKLKVVMSAAECKKYKVSGIESGEGSTAVRAALSEILSVASDEVGFTVEGERLLVQVYPLTGGGAELFITKLSAIPERDRRAVTEGGVTTYAERRACFRIQSSEALVAAARARPDRRAQVYRSLSGEYYLTVHESTLGGVSDCDVFLEFGDRIHKLPLGIDGEYGTPLLADEPLGALLASG